MEPRLAQDAKMGQMAAPMAASCDQKAPRSTQERQVGALLGAYAPILEAFWGVFAKKRESEKPLKTLGFLRFLLVWERLAGHLEASWGPWWLILASTWRPFCHFGAMLGNVGAKMANKRGKIATKSAKMSQDRRTWVAKANEGCALKELPVPVCERSGPPRALEFARRKDQRGRQDLAKNLQGFGELFYTPADPYGDGGYPVRCARKAATVPISIFEALRERISSCEKTKKTL